MKIISIGNSIGVIFPKELVKELGFKIGDTVEILPVPTGAILTKAKPRTGWAEAFGKEFAKKVEPEPTCFQELFTKDYYKQKEAENTQNTRIKRLVEVYEKERETTYKSGGDVYDYDQVIAYLKTGKTEGKPEENWRLNDVMFYLGRTLEVYNL